MAPRWDSSGDPPDAIQKQEEFVRRATKRQPSRILDIGCGTGVLVPHLRKLCPNASLVELDFSSEMLVVNRNKHGESAIEYCCNAIESAPFPDETFDAILCFNALPHFNIEGSLCKSAALLKPKGRIAIGHLKNSDELNAFHSALNGPVAHDHLPAATELSKMLADLGLTVLQCEERLGWYFVLSEKSQTRSHV